MHERPSGRLPQLLGEVEELLQTGEAKQLEICAEALKKKIFITLDYIALR